MLYTSNTLKSMDSDRHNISIIDSQFIEDPLGSVQNDHPVTPAHTYSTDSQVSGNHCLICQAMGNEGEAEHRFSMAHL
jgi:hypothetical protein